MQALSIGMATIIVFNSTQSEWYNIAPSVQAKGPSLLTEVDKLSLGIHVMLCLRAFKRALTSPLLFPVEVIVALYTFEEMKSEDDFWMFWVHKFSLLGLLVFAQFVIHRCRVAMNKLVYIIVSFITAFKNKKQRIRS